MTLSDLKTGDEAYIVKVKGHGGFRKRILEMGFIKGQRVDVLQCAPLQDPVKYKVMGYEVSLRRQEAEKIEVTQDEREAAGISEPLMSVSSENINTVQPRVIRMLLVFLSEPVWAEALSLTVNFSQATIQGRRIRTYDPRSGGTVM